MQSSRGEIWVILCLSRSQADASPVSNDPGNLFMVQSCLLLVSRNRGNMAEGNPQAPTPECERHKDATAIEGGKING